MADGPTILYDKSALQALNTEEAFVLNCHYHVNIVPVFYAETLADLHKSAHKGRTPEQVVGALAAKISGMNAFPNVHHTALCIGDLLGYQVETCGVPVVGGGKVVKSDDGRTGMFFDEAPEITAMRRWQQGDFLGVERDFAKGWRDALEQQDLPGIAAALRTGGRSPLHSLADVRAAADFVAAGRGKRHRTLKLALAALQIPPVYHAMIMARWKARGGPPLHEFAPYAAHVFRVELFFFLGIASHQIAATRPSHRLDLAYLFYLPFCKVFSSCDKFHAAIVPHFLEQDQVFVPGTDLKADLGALAAYYAALPHEERAKGAMTYAAYPPRTGNFLISRLFDRFYPGWREHAASPINVTPEMNQRIMEHLKPMLDAIEKSRGESSQ